MKVRSGFISNSSSSSFLVCGISDIDSINTVLMKNDIITIKIPDTDTIIFSYYLRNDIEHTLGLEVHQDEYGRVYSGKSITLNCGDVNINQIKELISSVENALSDIEPSKIMVDYIEERY